MWYPLYQAAKKWNKIDEEAQLTYRRALSRAQIEDQDGIQGRQHVDDDGILIYPHEDNVPRRDESSSEEEEQVIPQ